MFKDFKRKLLGARAQGAYVVAETALKSGDAASAARLFASQARDLAARGMKHELVLRGYVGVLEAACAAGSSGGDQVTPDLVARLKGALPHLATVEAAALPTALRSYDAHRQIIVHLLCDYREVAAALARHLVRVCGPDPRAHYALGRALAPSTREQAGEVDDRVLREAIGAYRRALEGARQVRNLRRWEGAVVVRLAQLLHWKGGLGDPEARREAIEIAEGLAKPRLRALDPRYQLVLAEIGLRSNRSMVRLRCLDRLGELASLPGTSGAALRIVERYLSELGWSFYPTELDRIVEAVEAAERSEAVVHSPSNRALQRLRRHLDLLASLHAEKSVEAPQSDELLRRLEEHTDDPDAESYYKAALTVAERGEVALSMADFVGLDDPRGLAKAALILRAEPNERLARQIAQAGLSPHHDNPHSQQAVMLAMPVFVAHLDDWIDSRETLCAAAARSLQLAPEPHIGFGPIGLAWAHAGHDDLAELAGLRLVRSQAPRRSDDRLLLQVLAAAALQRGQPRAAVAWLTRV